MPGRHATVAYAAVVLLTALQPALLYGVGGTRYEPGQVVFGAVVVLALARLRHGSQRAWLFLVTVNALAVVLALFVSLAAGGTIGTALVILAASAGPLLCALLSPPMLRAITPPPAR